MKSENTGLVFPDSHSGYMSSLLKTRLARNHDVNQLKAENITDLYASMPKFLKCGVITSVVDGFLTVHKLVRSEKKKTQSTEKKNKGVV